MFRALHEYDGVGLSANQIGKSVQLMVVKFDLMPDMPKMKPIPPLSLFNPRFEVLGDETFYAWESCLSVPDRIGRVKRHKNVAVHYIDLNGDEKTLRAHGFHAAIFQHEIDHLNGKLYIDRVSSPKDLIDSLDFNPDDDIGGDCEEGEVILNVSS